MALTEIFNQLKSIYNDGPRKSPKKNERKQKVEGKSKEFDRQLGFVGRCVRASCLKKQNDVDRSHLVAGGVRLLHFPFTVTAFTLFTAFSFVAAGMPLPAATPAAAADGTRVAC